MSTQAERRAATTAAILASARALFAARGFEATSIDDISEGARVAKGAVYHHFDSKEAVFTRVLESVQEELAQAPPPGAGQGDVADQIASGVEHYLLQASAPAVRRILLVDGPAVIGWQRWREIDNRYFGAGARVAAAAMLGPKASAAQVDALTHLMIGAATEAALVCATADDPAPVASVLAGALRRLLKGLARTT